MSTADDIKAAASGETAPGTMSQAATLDSDITAALAKLDPKDDTHWTSDDKPAMDALNALLPAAITRKRLEEVAPDFKRPSQKPPVDNQHVADGAQQFSDADVSANQPSYLHSDGIYRSEPQTTEAVAEDLAFLRNQFGWPTKDA